MESGLVSVIVPVYNAQLHLRKCLDSICGQTYPRLQIILINDGSADDSLSICEEYRQKDSRVEIISGENHGVSHSRNLGLEAARGEYIQFVDSDDYLTSDSTRLLVERAEETSCDMVIAPYYRVIGQKAKIYNLLKGMGQMEKDKLLYELARRPGSYFWGVVWNKFYRGDIIAKHSVRFCEDVALSEDFIFNLDYIRHAQGFSTIPTPIYYYIKTKGSLSTHYLSPMDFMKLKQKIFVNYEDLFKHQADYEKYKLRLYKYYISTTGHR